MSDLTKIELNKLIQLPIFKGQEKKVLEELTKILEEVKYPQGTEIFAEGSTGDALYIILSGEVLIAKLINIKTDEKKPLALFKQGDFFGEMSLLEYKPRSASALAKTEVDLLRLPRKEYQNLLRSKPEIAANFLLALNYQLSARLRHTSKELTLLFDTGKIIGMGKSLREMCSLLLERIHEGIPQSEASFFALKNDYTDEYEIIASRSLSQEKIQPLSPDDPLILYSFKQLKNPSVWLTEDFASVQDQSIIIHDFRGQQVQSVLVFPLREKGKFLGLVTLFNFSKQNAFTKEDLQLLAAVGSQVTPAIEIANYLEEEKARERLARAKERIS